MINKNIDLFGFNNLIFKLWNNAFEKIINKAKDQIQVHNSLKFNALKFKIIFVPIPPIPNKPRIVELLIEHSNLYKPKFCKILESGIHVKVIKFENLLDEILSIDSYSL